MSTATQKDEHSKAEGVMTAIGMAFLVWQVLEGVKGGVKVPDRPDMLEINWEVVAKAWLHPTQVKVLELMIDRWNVKAQPISPVQMHDILDENLGNVSYHVRRLAGLGLLKLVRKRSKRGAIEHMYGLHPRGFRMKPRTK